MRRLRELSVVLIATGLLALAGCNNTDTRIAGHTAEFDALPPATQQAIRNGVVEPGYTTTMVEMALGKPAEITRAGNSTLWVYRREPATANNETIQSGYRRRVVYDPVKRSNDIVVEPVDTKAFPHPVPHLLRLTFQAGRLASVEQVDRR